MAAEHDIGRAAKFATAGLGGIFGWCCIHPFNTLAVRMNLANMTNPNRPPQTIVPFARGVIAAEGVATLYKGLSAGIVRQIFYATSRFGLYEVFRDELAKYRETDVFSRLLTGSLSGGMAALISCPAEVSLVRISNDRSLPLDQRRNYKGVADAGLRILREEGVGAFWRGSTPFVGRAMLVGATQVGTYDQFKQMYRGFGIEGAVANVSAAAMTSGLLYSLITMPFETIKNRMAFQRPDASTGELLYKSTFGSMRTVAATEGPLALWRGFLPYYGRCGGHTISMFIAVEFLRNLL